MISSCGAIAAEIAWKLEEGLEEHHQVMLPLHYAVAADGGGVPKKCLPENISLGSREVRNAVMAVAAAGFAGIRSIVDFVPGSRNMCCLELQTSSERQVHEPT